MSLPRKSQLALLTLARLSEPLTMSSLRAYMFYQLKSFNPALPDSTIAYQAGLLTTGFTAAQFLTAMLWGRLADSDTFGRKRILLIGLIGTGISSLGFGFSTSFAMAMFFRTLGGVLNGNTGVMRTMVNEIISDRKYQSRAFMLLPMTGNVGNIIGPIIGGLLSDPINQWPGIFGPGSFIGGEHGVQWMITYPYALPNLVSAVFLIGSGLCVILGLQETHYMLRDRPDWGLATGRSIKGLFFRRKGSSQYSLLASSDPSEAVPANHPDAHRKKSKPKLRRTLPFRRIFTRNVVITLASRGFMAMHIGTWQTVWYVFMSTQRADNSQTSGFLHFTGGLGFPPPLIGLAYALVGVIGVAVQFVLYPPLQARFGTVNCYRFSLFLFPIVYFLAPFLARLPSTNPLSLPASGAAVWAGILFVLSLHVFGRMIANPAGTMLINNCCPHPSVLSSIHGVGQSVMSGMRMLGPLTGGWVFGAGLDAGVVGVAFWATMLVALVAGLFSMLVWEGDGHEIILEGDEEYGKERVQMRELRR
ncbi:MFS general substrate transporter [Trichodelitschia bisporula]|uniref:MFS general substrate transporter n=1 Tax=Trichodelitschia bisporula TaxID=703511 RepID=A0A6G1HTF5_9PEZI|nr:MFS general substrate transporter [Trichodelitschia bisporula]